MGLILCENRQAVHPLFIPDMGLRVFSLEELCYVIYNYPLIAMDGLVNQRLMSFLRDDLRIGLQIVNLERSMSEWPDHDDVLLSILGFSDYYSSVEIEDFRARIHEIRKTSRYEFYRMKGDLLFELGQYGKAITYYEKSLFVSKDQTADDIYFYRVCRNMGSTYANLYQLDEAYLSYMKAYEYKKDEEVKKQIYFLARLQDDIEKKELYLKAVEGQSIAEWDNEFEEIMHSSDDDASLDEINELRSLDAVKRRKSIETILNRWKRKYRNML